MCCGISYASQLYLGGMDLVAIQETLGRAWVATTMNYIHAHATHVEDAWIAGQHAWSSARAHICGAVMHTP